MSSEDRFDSFLKAHSRAVPAAPKHHERLFFARMASSPASIETWGVTVLGGGVLAAAASWFFLISPLQSSRSTQELTDSIQTYNELVDDTEENDLYEVLFEGSATRP